MCCSPPQVNVFLPTKLWCKKGWDHSPYFADGKTQAPWLVMGGLFAQQLIHIMPQLYEHILGFGHYGRCCWHDPTLSSEQATFGYSVLGNRLWKHHWSSERHFWEEWQGWRRHKPHLLKNSWQQWGQISGMEERKLWVYKVSILIYLKDCHVEEENILSLAEGSSQLRIKKQHPVMRFAHQQDGLSSWYYSGKGYMITNQRCWHLMEDYTWFN